MMGSVRERTAEIGIFRAIGFRRSHVMQIILLEAAVISALAGILGYLTGFGATKGILHFFASNGAVFVPFNLELAGWALGIALGVGLISSIYPALIAARLDPNEALRAI
jgi:putative ABC transport system permease protein